MSLAPPKAPSSAPPFPTMRPFLVHLGHVLILAGAAFGQQPEPIQQTQPGTYSLQVKSQLVALDVVVTDKHGDIVRNLTKDDFKVFEGRTEQTITNIDLPGSEVLDPHLDIHTARELDRLAPNAAVSIIVLDEANSPFEDQAFARYSLQSYLKAQGDRLAQPTMLVSVGFSNFYVLREFTTSRSEVLSALDHHFASLSSHLESGSFAGQQFSQALSSLIAIAQATVGHPGHKNILWVGQGFPTTSSNSHVEDRSSLAKIIRGCTDTLRDGRITLYAVDPQGVSKPGSSISDKIGLAQLNTTVGAGGGSDPFGTSIDFGVLVEATGGRSLRGRNDVDDLIGIGIRDGADFYTLFYRPTEVTDQGQSFRSIRVSVKDPSLHATARTGYYPRGAPSAVPAPTVPRTQPAAAAPPRAKPLYDVSFASRNMLVYDGLPTTVARVDPSGDAFRLTVKNEDLLWKDVPEGDGKRNASITLVVLSFDRKGRQLSRYAQTVDVQSTNSNGRTIIPATVATAKPVARLRFILRDNASGKIGADNVFFLDPKELSGATTGMNH